jgi:Aph-1 protein
MQSCPVSHHSRLSLPRFSSWFSAGTLASSCFTCLVGLLLAATVWISVPPLRTVLAFVVPFAVVILEAIRFLSWKFFYQYVAELSRCDDGGGGGFCSVGVRICLCVSPSRRLVAMCAPRVIGHGWFSLPSPPSSHRTRLLLCLARPSLCVANWKPFSSSKLASAVTSPLWVLCTRTQIHHTDLSPLCPRSLSHSLSPPRSQPLVSAMEPPSACCSIRECWLRAWVQALSSRSRALAVR